MRNLKLEYKISKLEKQIFEAKQVSNLYHVCALDAYLEYIYPNDQLSASGNYMNHLYKGTDYVSFTRDKYYVLQTSDTKHVDILLQLVVDGDKLSNNYKVRPYNDMVFSYNGKFNASSDNSKIREMEEAVKGPIKNISKYIKEIRFDLFKVNRRTIKALKELAYDPKFSNFVYYNFRREDKQPNTKQLIKEAGIKNGDPIQLVAERLASVFDYYKS